MEADELLKACEAAPKFGVNAKAIILQAAAEVDEEDGEVQVYGDSPSAEISERDWLSRCTEFMDAVDPTLRPLVAYVPRSKLPRTVRKRAFAWAEAQEQDLFRRCMGVSVYQNKAVQLTALDWAPTVAERPGPPAPEPAALLPRKRRRRLLETSIDWDAMQPEGEEEAGNGGGGRKEQEGVACGDESQMEASGGGAQPPASHKPPAAAEASTTKTVLAEAGSTALPESSEATAWRLITEAAHAQLSLLAGAGWGLGKEVVDDVAARCAAKILHGRESADAGGLLRQEGPRIRAQVWREAQAGLARAVRDLEIG